MMHRYIPPPPPLPDGANLDRSRPPSALEGEVPANDGIIQALQAFGFLPTNLPRSPRDFAALTFEQIRALRFNGLLYYLARPEIIVGRQPQIRERIEVLFAEPARQPLVNIPFSFETPLTGLDSGELQREAQPQDRTIISNPSANIVTRRVNAHISTDARLANLGVRTIGRNPTTEAEARLANLGVRTIGRVPATENEARQANLGVSTIKRMGAAVFDLPLTRAKMAGLLRGDSDG